MMYPPEGFNIGDVVRYKTSDRSHVVAALEGHEYREDVERRGALMALIREDTGVHTFTATHTRLEDWTVTKAIKPPVEPLFAGDSGWRA